MLTEVRAAACRDIAIFAQQSSKKKNFHAWCIAEDTNFKVGLPQLTTFKAKSFYPVVNEDIHKKNLIRVRLYSVSRYFNFCPWLLAPVEN